MNSRSSALAFLLILFFLALPAFCSDAPKIVNVEKTPRHREFFEIPALLSPKDGYSFVKTESGVADKKKKLALEGSLVHIPFEKLLEEIKNGRLSENKMEVKSQSSFIWNGDRAELLKIFQSGGKATIGKWVLIVERGSATWMISAAYSANDANASQNALDIIKSAWWQQDKAESAQESAPALPDMSGTPFKAAGFRSDTMIFTKDGKLPTQDPDKALFAVSEIAEARYTQERREAFAKEHLAAIEPGAALEVISNDDETINGSPAIVTVAYAASGEQKKLIYQAALFRMSKVTVFVGIAGGNTAENLEYFSRLTELYTSESVTKGDGS